MNMRHREANDQVDHDLRSPRISWSILIMGAGVIASVVLNYAAYDTRITVLERAKIADDKVLMDIRRNEVDLRNDIHDLDIRVIGAERDIRNNDDNIKRNVKQLDKTNSDLDKLKDTIKSSMKKTGD